jgi:hypothetical protein
VVEVDLRATVLDHNPGIADVRLNCITTAR